MPRPRGGEWLEGEIKYFKKEGVDSIVSLLTLPEIIELNLSKEKNLCKENCIEFFSVPVEDRGIPESIHEIYYVVSILADHVKNGKKIAVHCRQGIGRSSLLAASLLTFMNMPVDEAFKRIEQSRGREVPDTIGQKKWVSSFSDFIKMNKI